MSQFTSAYPPDHQAPPDRSGADAAAAGEPDLIATLDRLRTARDQATSLKAAAEICVEIEEVLGGRPPTRGLGCVSRHN